LVELVEHVSVDDDGVISAESIKNISLYYQNINRSKTKTGELFLILSVIENDYDVIVLVKTNFDSSIKNEEVLTIDTQFIVTQCAKWGGEW
jgi:hypothetical protein